MGRSDNEWDDNMDMKLWEEWRRVYKWYKQYKELKQRQQEIAREAILIPWDDYSKGLGWL